jgi:hypothetical protein
MRVPRSQANSFHRRPALDERLSFPNRERKSTCPTSRLFGHLAHVLSSVSALAIMRSKRSLGTQNFRVLPDWKKVRMARLPEANSRARRTLARRKVSPMKRFQKSAFSPTEFLANAGIGRRIVELRKAEALFSQGDKADSVSLSRKDVQSCRSFPNRAT